MNKVIMMGRLTRDPELRYTKGEKNTAVANFGIAVDRRIKRQGDEDADFFNCTAWGKTAEHMQTYWHKGMKALIEGRIEIETWMKDGEKKSAPRITVESIEFCEAKQENAAIKEAEKKAEEVDLSQELELPFNF